MPAIVRCMDDRLPSADGDGHLVHLCGGRRGDLRGQGIRRRGRCCAGRRPAGAGSGSDRQILASVRPTDRLGHCGHIDRFLAADRGRRKFRRWLRCRGFRQLAEPDAGPGLAGRLSGVPAADEGHGQAAFGAVRPGGRLCGGDGDGQGRSFRFRAPADRVRAADHAVQARVRPGCDHLAGPAVRGLLRGGAGRHGRADEGGSEPSAHRTRDGGRDRRRRPDLLGLRPVRLPAADELRPEHRPGGHDQGGQPCSAAARS